jgi:uncharacterized membrane protein YdfJ with MMPL/SSD domain
VLGLLGLGVEQRLQPTSLNVRGSESAPANQLLERHFGDSAPFAILLQGPRAGLDTQGPRLVRALRARRGVTTLSPWDRGAGMAGLRPGGDTALILVDFHVPVAEAVQHTVPELGRIVDRVTSSPVRAHFSGFARISRALQDESISATQRGEMIAVPILIVVLLLVFRSAIAAAIPLAFGGATVIAARGLLAVLASYLSIDAQALRAVGRAYGAVSGRDPRTGEPVSPGYDGLPRSLAAARARLLRAADLAQRLGAGAARFRRALGRLHRGAARLRRGGIELGNGGRRLALAGRRLLAGGSDLSAGLARLLSGAERLARGLSRLHSGTVSMGAGLGRGYRRSAPLVGGLERARSRVSAFRSRLSASRGGLSRLERRSPKLFDSGYFVLSALDGTRPTQRQRIGQAVSLHDGGQAAQMLIVPKPVVDTPRSLALDDRLQRYARGLSGDSASQTGVTGGAAQLIDYDRATSSMMPLLIATVSLVTYLALVVALRALLLPALAVILNVATVAAAFGVLTFLYQLLPGSPLGGAGYLDAVGTAGIFGIVFGLSIDYAVFLLTRMREGYLAGGDADAAIDYGLERTAGVITGAAAIMAGVFVTFASAPIATIGQFGVGLTVAVLLDATVVRLILLPALMRLFGRRVWWLPRSLDRLLPGSESVRPSLAPATAPRAAPAPRTAEGST